jgi:hypothetical protein
MTRKPRPATEAAALIEHARRGDQAVFPDAGDWTVELGLQQLAVQAEPVTVSVGWAATVAAAGPVGSEADKLACD